MSVRLLTVLALIGAFLVAAPVTAYLYAQSTATTDVRITARLLENGKVEFGLQQRAGDGWGEIMLPRVNKFPYAKSKVGDWRYSSPVTVEIAIPTTPDPPAETASASRFVVALNNPGGGVTLSGAIGADVAFNRTDVAVAVISTRGGTACSPAADYAPGDSAVALICLDPLPYTTIVETVLVWAPVGQPDRELDCVRQERDVAASFWLCE